MDGALYARAPQRDQSQFKHTRVRARPLWAGYSSSSLTKWMIFLNLLGAAAHFVGVVLTLTAARHSFKLQMYRLKPINYGNATDPRLGRESVFDFWVYPSWIVVAFFSLSLGFHVFVSTVLLTELALGQRWYTTWYMKGLYFCNAWWRWGEYLFSASIMLVITCMLLGIREYHVVLLVTGLMATTICFGWLTELHSSSLIMAGADPYELCGWTLTRRWLPGSWKTRFQMHLLGYLPYALLWTVVFDQFRMNMEVVKEAVPPFVNTATIGSFCIFTLFGLVQLANQLFPYGPSVYWVGEVAYVVLSFAAKAQLGFMVVYQALVPGSPYDEALDVVLGMPG